MPNINGEASEKPIGAPPLAVDESRALRQQRQQARFRNRGGIFVPQEKNTLLDLLMARTITGESPPRRARSRSLSLSPSKSARTSTSGKAKAVNRRKSSIRPSEKAVKARRKSVAAQIAKLQDERDKDDAPEGMETPASVAEPKAGPSQKLLNSQSKKKSSKKSFVNKPPEDSQEPEVVEIEVKTSKLTQKANAKPKKQTKSAVENDGSNKTTKDAQPKKNSRSKKKSKQASAAIERSEPVLALGGASSPKVSPVTKLKGKSKAKPKKGSKETGKEEITSHAEDEFPFAKKTPPRMSKEAKDNTQADAINPTTKSSYKRPAHEVDIENDGDSSPPKPQKRAKQLAVEKSKGTAVSNLLNLTIDPKVPAHPLETVRDPKPADVLESSADDESAKAKSGGSGKKHGKKVVPLSEKNDDATKNVGRALKKRNREDGDGDSAGSREDDEVMKPVKKKSKAGVASVVGEGDQPSSKPKPAPKSKSRRQKENATKPGPDSKPYSKKKPASESSKKSSQKTASSQLSKKNKAPASAPITESNRDTQPVTPPANTSDNKKNGSKAESASGRAATAKPAEKIKKGLPTPIRKRVHVAGWASPLSPALVPSDDEPDPIDFLS